MTEMYGHKWTSVHGLSDESGTWSKVMGGLTGQQIANGMQSLAVSDDPWPPSAPEFRALCEAGASGLGVPSVEAAWREASEASSQLATWKFSHLIVQEAGRLTAWYNVRCAVPTAEKCRRVFEGHYIDLMQLLRSGHPIIDGQLLIGQERALSAKEASEKMAEEELRQRIEAQGLANKTPGELRRELLAKMGIKR